MHVVNVCARSTAGGEEREVGPGDVVVVPAVVEHAFRSTGDVPLRQLSLHLAPEMLTEWLEDER